MLFAARAVPAAALKRPRADAAAARAGGVGGGSGAPAPAPSATPFDSAPAAVFFDEQLLADEYDPLSPSSYEGVLRARAMAARAAAALARVQEDAAAAAAAAPSADMDVDAGGRGIDNRPAWMAAGCGGGGAPADLSPPPSPPPPPPVAPSVRSKVERMMANWGYKMGRGLGRDENGMAVPLIVTKTGRNTGVIIPAKPLPRVVTAAAVAAAAAAAPPAPPAAASAAPSRVFVLCNLVAPSEEPDDALEAEVSSEVEAGGWGPVEMVFCYQEAPPPAPPGRGPRVFVAVATPQGAAGAAAAFHGRGFAGRRVLALPFSEERLRAWDLAATEAEAAQGAAWG